MIQEMLGVVEERKISIPGGLLLDASSSSPTSSVSSQSQSSASSSPASSAGEQQTQPQQNSRCPRCDSSNTKFCYYNNYNLTQPRHFCKTCRRYWTKGGALRNVPIGGGCRKTKAAPSIASLAVSGKSGTTKVAKPAPSELLMRSGLVGGLEHELPSSPIFWASPHTTHLMALLKASSAQNPNPSTGLNLNSYKIRDDGAMLCPQMVAEASGGSMNGHNLSLDPFDQLPLATSLWKNNNNNQLLHQQQQQQQQQQHSQAQQQSNILLSAEIPSSGMKDLYQRFKSSSTNYYNEQLLAVVSHAGSFDFSCSSATLTTAPAPAAATATASMATSITTATSIMEPVPLSVGEFGYWNPALSWSDLPTTNGAFP